MKYDTAPEFDADFKRLKEREQRLFIDSVRKMIQVLVPDVQGHALLSPVIAIIAPKPECNTLSARCEAL